MFATTVGRRTLAILAAAGLTVTVAGCGSSNSSVSASTSGSATTPASASSSGGPALAADSGKNTKVSFVGLYNGPYIANVSNGAKAASADVGSPYTSLAPTALNPNQAISIFQNTVASGANVALVMAYPGDVWRAPITTASRQGVTVGTNDDDSEGSAAKFQIGAPKAAMGAGLADQFVKALPPHAKGTIVPGICVPGLAVLLSPVSGFAAEMKKQLPGVTVAKPATTSGDPSGNFSAWQRIISSNPNALGFFGVCDADLPNLVKIKQKAAGSKWLAGTTAGADDPASIPAIKTGALVGAVSQRGYVQGYVGTKLLLQIRLAKRHVPNTWLNSGYDMVTKDNADAIGKVLQSPAAAAIYYKGIISSLLNNPVGKTPLSLELTSADQPNPAP